MRAQSPKAGGRYTRPTRVRLETVGVGTVPALGGMSCDRATQALKAAGLDSDCRVDSQWWSVGTPSVYKQTQAPDSLQVEHTVVTTQARAVDVGKIGAGVLAALAALGTALVIVKPAMHLSVRMDPNPAVTIREGHGTEGELAGPAIRGVVDAEGSVILRLLSKGSDS